MKDENKQLSKCCGAEPKSWSSEPYLSGGLVSFVVDGKCGISCSKCGKPFEPKEELSLPVSYNGKSYVSNGKDVFKIKEEPVCQTSDGTYHNLEEPMESWEEEFEKKFNKPIRNDIHKILATSDLINVYYDFTEIKSFIKEVRAKAYKNGVKDGILRMEKPRIEAISKAVSEDRERIVKGVEKIGTVELLGIKEMIKVEDVFNVINNLEK